MLVTFGGQIVEITVVRYHTFTVCGWFRKEPVWQRVLDIHHVFLRLMLTFSSFSPDVYSNTPEAGRGRSSPNSGGYSKSRRPNRATQNYYVPPRQQKFKDKG